MAKRSNDHLKAQKEGKERDLNICQICGSTNDCAEVVDLDDVQFGGINKDNIVTLCDEHHKRVSATKSTSLNFRGKSNEYLL